MRDTMVHRGPDDAGSVLLDGGCVGLGHRRLAIVDVSPKGHEPMPYRNERYWLTFNGEIYNFRELRVELESAGAAFRSDCDAEVVLAAYAEWGPDCVERFAGMWAFAIWDDHEKTLFCARDRFGIKPFYYFDDGEVFIFASEIRAILASGYMPTTPNAGAMAVYLGRRRVDGWQQTFFESIERLPPAHSLMLSYGKTVRRRYWQLPQSPLGAGPDAEDAARVHDQLSAAVESHLMADVPVGVSLSGGLDSSAVLAFATRHGREPVRTFSAYYEEEARWDERRYIDAMNAACRAEAQMVLPRLEALIPSLPKMIWHLEEPPLMHGVYPRWHVMGLAGSHVKVVLGGQGGDEIFGGYGHHYIHYLRDCLAERNAARLACEAGAALLRQPGRFGGYFLKRARERVVASGKQETLSRLQEGGAGPLLLDQPTDQDDPPMFVPQQRQSRLHERLCYDLFYGSLPPLLKYDDKIGMAFSVECRVPFLDHRLVELAFSLSPMSKFNAGWSKHVLRRALADALPKEIVWREGKLGFPTPFEPWFAGPLLAPAREIILDGALAQEGYLDRRRVEEQLQAHRDGRQDITGRLWQWLGLQIWFDLHRHLSDTGARRAA